MTVYVLPNGIWTRANPDGSVSHIPPVPGNPDYDALTAAGVEPVPVDEMP